MFTFIHAADIHLDSPLRHLERYEGAPVEELRLATRRSLENLTALALAEKVDFLLIAGDLFDGDWRDFNTGLHFIGRMAALREAEIPVFLVAGNHDAANKMSKQLKFPDNVRVFGSGAPETARLRLPDGREAAVHGQGYASRDEKRDLARGYPLALPGCFNIGLLHTALSGVEGHAPYAPCTLETLKAKGYDYWALGHNHRRETFSEDPFIGFSGNIQGRHIREPGAKGCLLARVDDQGRCEREFRPLDALRWARLTVDAGDAVTVAEIRDRIASALRHLLGSENHGLALALRLEIQGRTPAHNALFADWRGFTGEARAMALDLGRERLWLEKIEVHTEEPQRKGQEELSGPLAVLEQVLEDLAADPAALAELAQPLLEMRAKLPREVRQGDKGFTGALDMDAVAEISNQDWLAAVLKEVRPLLLGRLLGGAAESGPVGADPDGEATP